MNKTYEERWLKNHYARDYPCHLSGYLMRDGRYIDMVDKCDVDRGAFYRDDHRSICHIYNSPKCESGGDCMFDFMERGNIRFSPETPGFQLIKAPTNDQWYAMKELWEERMCECEDSGKDLYFEVVNKNGSLLFETTDFYIFRDYVEEHL